MSFLRSLSDTKDHQAGTLRVPCFVLPLRAGSMHMLIAQAAPHHTHEFKTIIASQPATRET
jgi:hypothetical protein